MAMDVHAQELEHEPIFSDSRFPSREIALMVLHLFQQNKIVTMYKNINSLFPSADNDFTKLDSNFGCVWIRSILIQCWCRYDSLFRTNNVAESFHATLARRILNAHPEFYTFADTVHRLLSEAMLKLQTQRVNPKSRIRRVECVRYNLKAIVDNHIIGPPLGLPIEELVTILFEKLHEKTRAEEFYECSDDDESDSSEVPMELVD